MDEVLKFLRANRIFFLGTSEGGAGRVRPLGFVMLYDGKLCLATGNQKAMYKQMMANPGVELCSFSEDGEVLRLSATAQRLDDRAAREKALESLPMLRDMYAVDDGIFEVVCLNNPTAFYSDVTGTRQPIAL